MNWNTPQSDITIALLISQQLRVLAQDLYKVGPANILSWVGPGRGRRTHEYPMPCPYRKIMVAKGLGLMRPHCSLRIYGQLVVH